MLFRGGDGVLHIVPERIEIIDNLHGPSAQNIGGPHHQREADVLADLQGFIDGGCRTVLGMGDVEGIQQGAEAIAILGQVDGIRRSAPHRHPGLFKGQGKLQGGLAAELNDDPVGLFQFGHIQHIFIGQRLEIEFVRHIIVGADRLGVAVDHNRLDAQGL